MLHWLVQHNTAYKDITLNCDCLATLPSEGIPSDLQKIYCNENVNDCEIDPDGSPLNTDEIPFNEETELTSTILSPELLNPQNQLITEELLQRPKFHWPDRNSNPLNEFRIELLAAMAFPTLIPGGKDNPTNTATMPKATQEGKKLDILSNLQNIVVVNRATGLHVTHACLLDIQYDSKAKTS